LSIFIFTTFALFHLSQNRYLEFQKRCQFFIRARAGGVDIALVTEAERWPFIGPEKRLTVLCAYWLNEAILGVHCHKNQYVRCRF